MTPEEFIAAAEEYYYDSGKKAAKERTGKIMARLRKYQGHQVKEIYERVLDMSEYFPKVYHVKKAAEELGFESFRHTEKSYRHTWERTDCKLCEGEGLVLVLYRHERLSEESSELIRKEVAVMGLHSERANLRGVQKGTYEAVARCKCMAGEAQTLPKGFRRYGRPEEWETEPEEVLI